MEALGERSTYLDDFQEFVRRRPSGEPTRIQRLRQTAIERFAELGFPTTRLEEWRFTNVAPIARIRFNRSEGLKPVSSEALARFSYEGHRRVVFVNGHLVPELSQLSNLPDGVIVESVDGAQQRAHEGIEAHLGRYANVDEHPFVALNTAFFDGGAFLYLPRGVVVEQPIHLLFLSSSNGEPVVSYPRNLIVVEESSQATIVESYAGLEERQYFSCAVTEIVGGGNSVIDHYKMQNESHEAFHIATHQVHLSRSANFSSHSISQGGGLVRNDVNAVLDGDGVTCILNGLYVATDHQHVDNHMRVEHAKPHCESHELYKGILDGHARAVFNGRIYVHPHAQKTDAKQTNRNLLLSKDALVNSNPQLEIFADDVKCTHGSTVGQLDKDALFYLRSRGIGEEAARSLLTYAFASEFVQGIKADAVRADLEEFLFTRLPGGEVVRQAV